MPVTGDPGDNATKEDVRRLYDRFDALTDDLHKRFVTETQLAATATAVAAELANMRANMARLDDWQTWAMRLVLGAVLLSLVAVVLVPR